MKSDKVESTCRYPLGYIKPKPIAQQVSLLAQIFSLSSDYAFRYIRKELPRLTLPEDAEGWFAIPLAEALAPGIKDPAECYCQAFKLVLEKLKAARRFRHNYEGNIRPENLRQTVRTIQALKLVAEKQEGDILIIPAQFGYLHRGESSYRARRIFFRPEFGLGALAVGCMILTHPERFAYWEQLHIDCTGDEFVQRNGQFDLVPSFCFYDTWLRLITNPIDNVSPCFGSVSGFVLGYNLDSLQYSKAELVHSGLSTQ